VQRVEKRLERLEIDNQELQGQVKRAYQQLNTLKIRNDYLEYKLQQYIEQEQSAVLGDEDEDEEELWSSVGNGIE
jgi:maltodextrin utilization protein YvdJ